MRACVVVFVVVVLCCVLCAYAVRCLFKGVCVLFFVFVVCCCLCVCVCYLFCVGFVCLSASLVFVILCVLVALICCYSFFPLFFSGGGVVFISMYIM